MRSSNTRSKKLARRNLMPLSSFGAIGAKPLLLTCSLLFTGCDEVKEWLDKNSYRGTHMGVQKCIEKYDNKIVSELAIKKLCVKKHEKVGLEVDNGKASYKFSQYNRGKMAPVKVFFSGAFKNNLDNFIVTSFSIKLWHDDMEGMEFELREFDGQWIEPGITKSFKIENSDLSFKPKKERIKVDDKALFQWDIRNIKGVEITVN